MTPNEKQPSRRDSLPEHTRYADTGCQLSPSCLRCPLERCQYDEPGGAASAVRRYRNAALLRAARNRETTPDGLATMFGLSRRTVFRVLRELQDER